MNIRRGNLLAIIAAGTMVISNSSCSTIQLARNNPLNLTTAKNVGRFRKLFITPGWEEILQQAKSPKEICRAVESYVSYKPDKMGDVWSSGRETWERGCGDCEDFAIAIVEMCYEIDLEASMIIYFPPDSPGEGHAFAVGRYEEDLWVSDRGSYKIVSSLYDIEEMALRILQVSPRDSKDLWYAKMSYSNIEGRLSLRKAYFSYPVGSLHKPD